jgi:short subunit dehydrogenase-like uncharacterized protein
MQRQELEVVELEIEQLTKLASRCQLIINGVGPYHLFSSPVVEACANTGAHYVGL